MDLHKIPHLIRTDYYGEELGPLLNRFYIFYCENRTTRDENDILPYGYLGKIESMIGLRSVFSRMLVEKYPPDLEKMAQDVEYLLSFLPENVL
jgi:hypothetical protein